MSILKDILDSFRRGGGLTKSYCNNQDKRYSVTSFWTSYVNKKYSKILVIEKESVGFYWLMNGSIFSFNVVALAFTSDKDRKKHL